MLMKFRKASAFTLLNAPFMSRKVAIVYYLKCNDFSMYSVIFVNLSLISVILVPCSVT